MSLQDNSTHKEQAKAFLNDPAQMESMILLSEGLMMKFKALTEAGFTEQQALYIIATQGIGWGTEE